MGEQEYLDLTADEAAGFADILDNVLGTLDQLAELPGPVIELKHKHRDPGRQATPEEDPVNAFTRKCFVQGAPSGALAGLTFGVKDNIAIAGIPLSNASRAASFVPTGDAVVVERLLDAGAHFVGMFNMDDFSTSPTGETSAYGPPRNPYDPQRSAGGSSGGTGAGVMSGIVDFGLGVDQGGSGRIPAAFCGAAALKATHGRVPTYGITHMSHTLDHICPVAPSIEMVARVAEVISGHDWRDPQWTRRESGRIDCLESLTNGVAGMTLAVIEEAIDENVCEPEVIDNMWTCLSALEDAGARITRVSIPLWKSAKAIQLAIMIHQNWAMFQSEGQGFEHLGYVDVERVHSFALSRRSEADLFPPYVKLWLLAGRYLHDVDHSVLSSRARNLRHSLKAVLDEALLQADLLVTPTCPQVAPLLSTEPRTDVEVLRHTGAWRSNHSSNTAALNLTGHPAAVVPSGLGHAGMPTSIQFIGADYCESTALRAAYVVEGSVKLPAPRVTGRRWNESVPQKQS